MGGDGKVAADIAAIREKVEGQGRELGCLNDAVFRGNGKPSLLARMERIEDRIARMERVVWLVGGSVLSDIVARVLHML